MTRVAVASNQPRTQMFDRAFDAMTADDVVAEIVDRTRSGRGGTVMTVNVAVLMAMREDEFLESFADRASLVVADGQPLVWFSSRQRTPLPERVTGIDLIDAVCAEAAARRFGVFLLGAHEATIKAAAQQLRGRHPGLEVTCGDGYFSDEEAPLRASRIAESGARVLFVGMGVPRQEQFIARHADALHGVVCICVGGSFEVIAGAKRRAPKWVQRIGMEWLVRLLQEPRRLLRRYVTTNTAFLGLVLRDLLKRPDLGAASAKGRSR